jgi:hypothetical protein
MRRLNNIERYVHPGHMQGITMWRIESAAARLREQQETEPVLKRISQEGSRHISADISISPGHSFLPAGSRSLTHCTPMRRASSGAGGSGNTAVLVPMEFSAHGNRGSADVATALAMTEAAYESLACLEGAGSGSLDALSAFHPDVAGQCVNQSDGFGSYSRYLPLL